MWCTSCANAVERVLKRQPGVVGASVSFAAESARVAWDTGVTTLAKLVDAVRTLGYEVSLDPKVYFDESGTAMQRVSRDASRSIVSAILEAF